MLTKFFKNKNIWQINECETKTFFDYQKKPITIVTRKGKSTNKFYFGEFSFNKKQKILVKLF